MDQDERQWHLDKKVPLALIGAVIVQTFVFGWWAAHEDSRISSIETMQAIAASTAAAAITANTQEFNKLEGAREDYRVELVGIKLKLDEVLILLKRPLTADKP